MIYVAICDDELKQVNIIKQYLLDYQIDTQCELKIYHFMCGKDLCESSITYDLIFLGIEMDGMDGLETAKIFRQKQKRTQIIFISDHSKYAINAFEVHPFHFIMRPVTDGVIFKVMDEFMEYFNYDISQNNILEFNGIKGPLLLDQTNIYIFEYIGNRRVAVFTQNEKYVIRGGIAEITQLVDSELFISPHRGFLVNMQYIKSLNNCVICMKNAMEVPIAQRKLREVQRFMSYLKSETKIKI